MKPNDKAIEAAATSLFGNYMGGEEKKWIEDALTAAYAAQFQSEDYAGLVKELRAECRDWRTADCVKKAADAIEAVLAEREAWKGRQEATATILKQVESERDALAAHLAPVEDEELIEVAAYYFTDGSSWSALSERLRNTCRKDARNVIAAIRPHIEEAERERCAKIAEGFLSNRDWVPGSLWGNIRNEIAAAIRSGK